MQVSLPQILTSKKFLAASLASVLSFFALRNGMTITEVGLVVSPLILYIPSQGAADIGKSKATIEKATP